MHTALYVFYFLDPVFCTIVQVLYISINMPSLQSYIIRNINTMYRFLLQDTKPWKKKLGGHFKKKLIENELHISCFILPLFREHCKEYQHYTNFLLTVPQTRCTWLHATLYTIETTACSLWELQLACTYGKSDFAHKHKNTSFNKTNFKANKTTWD